MATRKAPKKPKGKAPNRNRMMRVSGPVSRLKTVAFKTASMASAKTRTRLSAAGVTRKMSVKLTYQNGANAAKMFAYVFDAVNNRIVGDPAPIALSSSNSGSFEALVGKVYIIDCRFSGLLGASVQFTVDYPPELAGKVPAAEKKASDTVITNPHLGMNEVFLVVPTDGAIR